MNQQIEKLKTIRLYLIDQIKELSIEQINKIPAGSNNNIAWNFGHLVAAQQGVCYMRAGLTPLVSMDFFGLYKPGSIPEKDVDSHELEEIKLLSASTLQQLETDYANNLFENYPAWTSRYGVEIANINGAIEFLSFHEGYHAGCISVLKKLVCM